MSSQGTAGQNICGGEMGWHSRIFYGRTVGVARQSASVWLQDFGTHGPLEIKSIKTEDRGGEVVAIVTMRDMSPELPEAFPPV